MTTIIDRFVAGYRAVLNTLSTFVQLYNLLHEHKVPSQPHLCQVTMIHDIYIVQ